MSAQFPDHPPTASFSTGQIQAMRLRHRVDQADFGKCSSGYCDFALGPGKLKVAIVDRDGRVVEDGFCEHACAAKKIDRMWAQAFKAETGAA